VYDVGRFFLVLLANTAYRVQGEFDRDAAAMKSSCDDVNSMLCRLDRRRWGKSERFSILGRILQEVI
jgi:hypothetical protein